MTVGSFAPTDQVQAYAGKVKSLEARVAALELAQARPAPWVPFTPTWLNLTVGNATQDFYKRYTGKNIELHGTLTFGSTTVMGLAPELVLPDGVSSIGPPYVPVGDCHMVAALAHIGTLRRSLAPTAITLMAFDTVVNTVSGFGFIGMQPAAATIPFTWATGNFIRINASIPIA